MSKPLFLSARYGLPSHVESALCSIEPVNARFRVGGPRGVTVTGCQLPREKGKGWQEWEAV